MSGIKKYQETCSNCEGTGKMKEFPPYGYLRGYNEPCSDGYQKCPRCEGEGRASTMFGGVKDCPKCGGSGEIPFFPKMVKCIYCKGKGWKWYHCSH